MNSVPPPGGPEGVPPPGPQSGGQSARAIAMTIRAEPEVGSGAVMDAAIAAATTASMATALEVRQGSRDMKALV
ncbi:hypothetical protein, partial [Mycobacteroides abscessus]|uniref:hypothetical protein n=1 Tax=Mycobacteroides abscessus TaxID=36809 RepID=UPI003CE7C30D